MLYPQENNAEHSPRLSHNSGQELVIPKIEVHTPALFPLFQTTCDRHVLIWIRRRRNSSQGRQGVPTWAGGRSVSSAGRARQPNSSSRRRQRKALSPVQLAESLYPKTAAISPACGGEFSIRREPEPSCWQLATAPAKGWHGNSSSLNVMTSHASRRCRWVILASARTCRHVCLFAFGY